MIDVSRETYPQFVNYLWINLFKLILYLTYFDGTYSLRGLARFDGYKMFHMKHLNLNIDSVFSISCIEIKSVEYY